MGSQLVTFSFKTKENEQIEATIQVPAENRSVIHGIVKDHKNRLIKDAVVKLFTVDKDNCPLKPVGHTFTDDCGQFLFGPLLPHRHYVVKVWVNNLKFRELIIGPEDCYEHSNQPQTPRKT